MSAKGFGRLMLFVVSIPIACGVLFAVLYVSLVGLTVPQLPEWAQPQAAAWMNDIPQDSDAHPSEGWFYGVKMGEIPSTFNAVGWAGYSDENAGNIYGVPIGDYGSPPPIGCNFGYDPNYTMLGQGVPHDGDDWTVGEGNKVVAVMAGKIVYAGLNDGWGNLVVIENGDYQIWYGHLLEVEVTLGQIVEHGQPVALSGGKTPPAGNSTGAHLHEGIKLRSGTSYNWINPEQFMSPDEWADWPCK
jgi:murein DD-endopeptidase MepM/ murein hydrolase activator NlpD